MTEYLTIILSFFAIFYNLPVGLFRLLTGYYPSKVILKGELKGQKKLDMPKTLLISTCFWLFLWFIISNFKDSRY